MLKLMLMSAITATWASVAAAQVPAPGAKAIPIYRLAPAEASTKEKVGYPSGMKQFADGRLIVNDVIRQRLIVFDPSLANFTVSADSGGTGSGLYPRSFGVTTIFSYLGDSALFPDVANAGFTMIEPNGKFGRAIAHPRPMDLRGLSQPFSGQPAFDPRGRFIYRSLAVSRPPAAPASGAAPPLRTRDTTWIVRADFDLRTVDTLAQITLPIPLRPVLTRDDKGVASATLLVNPVPLSPDEWVVTSDGSIAVVRAHDYHIDWIYSDGTQASTPKMPFDWRRLTDADKQAKIDSVQHVIDSLAKTPL